jgi:MYXO-CTERM domain-containing protein
VRARAVVCAIVLTASDLAGQAPPALLIEAPPSMAAARARLEGFETRGLADLVRLVGLNSPGEPIRLVLADEGSEQARQVTPWTAGYALGEAGLIVLFPARSPSYPHDSLEDVLRHEVAHVLIDRAAAHRPVPRWLHEGLAMAAERPWGFRDRTRLASAVLLGPRLTLDDVDRLFLGDQGAQERAYALAGAQVRDLMSEHGRAAPAAILRELAAGVPFESAVARVTGQSVPAFEAAFWQRQRTWTLWVPLVTSSTTVWLAAIGLAALAVIRRRRRAAGIRRRWEEEEAAARTREG